MDNEIAVDLFLFGLHVTVMVIGSLLIVLASFAVLPFIALRYAYQKLLK